MVDEYQQDVEEFFKSVDTILLGRVTYEAFASCWPDKGRGIRVEPYSFAIS